MSGQSARGAESPAAITFGNSPPIRVTGTKIRSETFDAIIREAEAINLEVKTSSIEPLDHTGNDSLLKKLQESHKDFSTSFPIVVRWTVQARQFSSDAFRNFLLYYQKNANGGYPSVFPTREKFLEVQSEYLVYLYKSCHPRLTADQIRRYRQTVVTQLMEEDREFTKIHEDVDEDMKKLAREADQKRRTALYEYILRQRTQKEAPAASS